MKSNYKVWFGETAHIASGPGRIVAVVVAKDETEASLLALEMIGRAGRATITENVARMEWDVLGDAKTDVAEIVTGHWSR